MSTAPEGLLRRLEWQVVRRLEGRLQGSYRTLLRGSGIDMTGLREYTASDDVRHIDWNVTARLDEPYVRQYLQDRELTAWLVVDRTASMAFGSQAQDKRSVGAELAVTLARLFGNGGNRVGAILYDQRQHRVVAPAGGRTHVLRLAHEVTAQMPTGVAPPPSQRRRLGRRRASIETPTGPTDLAAMLQLAAATVRRRSLVFVISDFIGEGDWPGALARLGQRHEVVAIRVLDPAELDLPDVGVVLVQDAETGEQLLADSSDPLLRQRFDQLVAQREQSLAAAMQRAGVTAHTVGTGDDLVDVLVAMVRQSRGRFT